MERTWFGFMSELMKFWKYGRPYLAVMSNSAAAFSLSHGKSGVML